MLSCSRLTALALATEHEEYHEQEDEDTGGDERMAALVQAVPQLRALGLINYHATNTATNAGAAMHIPATFLLHSSKQCTAAINCVIWVVSECIPCNGVELHRPRSLAEAAKMHRAGLAQLSRLRKLQHLSLAGGFARCTHNGLGAALATMTGHASAPSARDKCQI
jgi:hypothetical protein